ncbi:hypothetical protein Tco_1569253 [Tanacetum coccineum]
MRIVNRLLEMMEKQAGAKGLTSPEQTATVEMVFSRPWTCTFLVAKGLATPELMANCTNIKSGSIIVSTGRVAVLVKSVYVTE